MESRDTLLPKPEEDMKTTYSLKCNLCGGDEKRTSLRNYIACQSCKEKRKREAAMNYYNLKRRKQYARN